MNINGVEVFEHQTHFIEARVEGLCGKFDILRGITGQQQVIGSCVQRAQVEDGAIIDETEAARAKRSHEIFRVLTVLGLRLIRLRQAFARWLEYDFLRIGRDIVGAVVRDLAAHELEEGQLGAGETGDAINARDAVIAEVIGIGSRAVRFIAV